MRNSFCNADRDPHEKFLELCALATSGELTDSELQHLDAHLSVCRECRDVMRGFNALLQEGIPSIAEQYLDVDETSGKQSWAQEKELSKLLKAVPQKSKLNHELHQNDAAVERFSPVMSDTWRNIFTLYTAAALLLVALGITVYQTGATRGMRAVAVTVQAENAIQSRLDDAKPQAAGMQAELQERNKSILELRRDLHEQSFQVNDLRLKRARLETDLFRSERDKQRLIADHSELAKKEAVAEQQLADLEDKLHAAEAQEAQQSAQVTSLQRQVSELQQSLNAKDKALDEGQQLLAYDRDIRELISARDLHVAEVYDVDQHGQTRKTFGRVFFTKGKSLVFYAYDLDQQNPFKTATFQAWGRRESDRQDALSLGIFYEDGASKKRWVLKSSDPKVLSHIDEVFVTVEPNGGSQKPSSRRILFAFLNTEPNHP
jgi:hypothetical protein